MADLMKGKTINMTASEQVLQWIEAYIARKRLGVGDGLPGEHDIMQETGMGRSSVREALTALKVLGIIQSRRKGGIRIIRDPVMLELRHYFADRYDDTARYEDVLEFRSTMDWGLGPLAMVRVKDSTIQSLRQLLQEVEEQAVGAEDITRAEIEFHRVLTVGCGNRLAGIFVHLYEPIFHSRSPGIADAFSRSPDFVKQWIAKHMTILDALESRDWARFSKELKDHTLGYMPWPEDCP